MIKKNALCDEEHSEDEGLLVSPSGPGFNFFSLRYTWCNQGQRWLHSEMHWIVIREAEVVTKRRNTNGFSLLPSVFAHLYLHRHGCLCGTTLVADQRWCYITVFSQKKNLGCLQESGFLEAGFFFAFITKPQETVLSQVRSTVQSQSVQLERQSIALFCGLI